MDAVDKPRVTDEQLNKLAKRLRKGTQKVARGLGTNKRWFAQTEGKNAPHVPEGKLTDPNLEEGLGLKPDDEVSKEVAEQQKRDKWLAKNN